MSILKSATSAVMALSLVAVPTIASAAPALQAAVTAPAGKVAARSGAPVRGAKKAGGSSIIIAVLAAAAVVAGIVIAADGSKSP